MIVVVIVGMRSLQSRRLTVVVVMIVVVIMGIRALQSRCLTVVVVMIVVMIMSAEELDDSRGILRLDRLLLQGKSMRQHVKQGIAQHRAGGKSEEQVHLSTVELFFGEEEKQSQQGNSADSQR